jgi:hypothetical protein
MVPNYRSGKTSPFVNPNKKGNVLDRCSYLRYGQNGGFASQSGKSSINQISFFSFFFCFHRLVGSTRVGRYFEC